MAIADELIALLGYELTGEDAARRYENSLKRIEKTAERVGAAIGTAIKVGTTVAAGALAFLGKSVISTSAQFETYQATLETIEGSADKARAALDWISKFAKTTPYDVAQVTASFVKLKAYGIDPIANDALRILGDTGAAMGKTLDQAVEAFADASTGEFERLKEFGIKAKTEGDNVTFSWTKNGQELTKTVKKNATEIRAFLLDTMGDRFTGAMDRQSRTWAGMMSNLGDTWTAFQRKIGEAGFFDKVSERLRGLLATLDRLDADGSLDRWAKGFSAALGAIADVLWAVGERVVSVTGYMIENFEELKPYLIAIGGLIATLFVKAFPLISVFTLLALAVDDFVSYLQGGESIIGDFVQALSDFMSGNPEAVAKAFGAIATAVGALAGAAAVMGTFTSAIWPLVFALGAFSGAFYLAKQGFDYLASLDAKQSKAVENPRSKPGYIESGGYDDKGEFIYMEGSRRVDRPPENPTKDFTEEALDYKFMLQNLEGNLEKLNQNSAVEATVNDNRADNRSFPQTNNVTVNQTVNQATDAPSAAANATANAVQGAVTQQRSQIETEPSF